MSLLRKPLSARERSYRSKFRAKGSTKKAIDLTIDPTFPDRLKPLAEKFYQEALTHPAFTLMSPTEIRRSIESRVWSIASTQPSWWGGMKRTATEAQLAALAKAREAREALANEQAEREEKLQARISATVVS